MEFKERIKNAFYVLMWWSRVLKKDYAKDSFKRIVGIGVTEKVAQSYELSGCLECDNAFTEKWQLNEILHK